MKKSLIAMFIVLCGIIIILSGCTELSDGKLTIVNDTGRNLILVEWNGYPFYHGYNEVWDEISDKFVNGLPKGSSDTRYVRPGYARVYFYYSNDIIQYQTDYIRVEPGEHVICHLASYGAFSVAGADNSLESRKVKLQEFEKATAQKTTN